MAIQENNEAFRRRLDDVVADFGCALIVAGVWGMKGWPAGIIVIGAWVIVIAWNLGRPSREREPATAVGGSVRVRINVGDVLELEAAPDGDYQVPASGWADYQRSRREWSAWQERIRKLAAEPEGGVR